MGLVGPGPSRAMNIAEVRDHSRAGRGVHVDLIHSVDDLDLLRCGTRQDPPTHPQLPEWMDITTQQWHPASTLPLPPRC